MLDMARRQVREGATSDAGVVAHPAELVALRHAARRLPEASAMPIQSALAGPYGSAIRGRGLDFEEVRQYQPGDDVRGIDWRVTARTGRVHSKVFREERERPVWILLDAGPSMRFGTRHAFKTVAAARAASLLAWSARDAGDRVGALVSTPEGVTWRRPASGETHLMGLLGAFSRATSARGERASVPTQDCLAQLRERVERGSRVFVLSDFDGFDAGWQRPLAGLARRGQLTCVLVYDQLEAEVPPPGRYRVSDGERVRAISTPAQWRRAQAQGFLRRREELKDFCRKGRFDLVPLRTDDDPARALAASLSPDRALRRRAS